MRNRKPIRSTRQVIHIVGEGLTELFYFKHLKQFMNYRYSITPRLFENNSIEKIEKKIVEKLANISNKVNGLKICSLTTKWNELVN